MSALVEVTGVSVKFTSIAGRDSLALDNLSLSVLPGEILSVVGPSGCGKSTLLKVLAGLAQPTTGSIKVNSCEHKIGFVFQQNTIFPWMTVERNLAYSLEVRGVNRYERQAESRRLSNLVGLDADAVLHKYPKELSGGESRRVAIGMALGCSPDILLLDEPTSQLDYFARVRMRQMIQRLWLVGRVTIVYVTHDIEEAIILGDRILVMEKGRQRDIFGIALRRPREESVLLSDAFAQYHQRVTEQFRPLLDSTNEVITSAEPR